MRLQCFFQSLNAKKGPRFWLDAAAEVFVLSDVFLPDGDAAFEFDLNLRFSDDDLLDQWAHDGRIVCAHDRAVLDATLEGVEDNLELSVPLNPFWSSLQS